MSLVQTRNTTLKARQ